MTSRRDEQWAKYEELGHKIVGELMPFSVVTLDDHIPGRESETDRQIDVSARWTADDAEYLMIVQIRDRKKPADVNTIGEFRSVIQDVGASKGVLICSGGFSKKAITYARKIGISLYSLHDAQSLQWSTELTVPIIWVSLTPKLSASFEVDLNGGDQLEKHPKNSYFVLSSNGGATIIDLMGTFERKWNAGDLNRTVGLTHGIRSTADLSLQVIDSRENRHWRPIHDFKLTYTVIRDTWLGHYRPAEFRGLRDFLNEKAFVPSFVSLEDVPMRRDPSWPKIDDSEKVAVSTEGIIVTTEAYELERGSGVLKESGINYLGPSASVTEP